MLQKETEAFFSLLRAGLWEGLSNKGSSLTFPVTVDWEKIYQFAEEQSVIGIVLAGIERYKNLNDNANLNISQELLLQWIGEV